VIVAVEIFKMPPDYLCESQKLSAYVDIGQFRFDELQISIDRNKRAFRLYRKILYQVFSVRHCN
jgi:hypothetical protein